MKFVLVALLLAVVAFAQVDRVGARWARQEARVARQEARSLRAEARRDSLEVRRQSLRYRNRLRRELRDRLHRII
jgi:hypothetical protein